MLALEAGFQIAQEAGRLHAGEETERASVEARKDTAVLELARVVTVVPRVWDPEAAA